MLCLGPIKSLSSLRCKLTAQGMAQHTCVHSQVRYHSAIKVPHTNEPMPWFQSKRFGVSRLWLKQFLFWWGNNVTLVMMMVMIIIIMRGFLSIVLLIENFFFDSLFRWRENELEERVSVLEGVKGETRDCVRESDREKEGWSIREREWKIRNTKMHKLKLDWRSKEC